MGKKPNYPYNKRDNRKKYDASLALRKAVRRGIVKPAHQQDCILCGRRAQDLHHHNGYDREHWLDVVPLCKACHRKQHKVEVAGIKKMPPLVVKRKGYCPVCDGPLPIWAQSNRVYCSAKCKHRAIVLRANRTQP